MSTDAVSEPAPEHPGALAARSELAYSIGQAGDPAAARDQFASLLPVRERVSGPDDPDTLATREELAYLTCVAGTAGCTLSHLDAYRKIVDDGLDMAPVLEDDVILPADLGSLADAVGKRLVGAEVALLSFDSRNPPCK